VLVVPNRLGSALLLIGFRPRRAHAPCAARAFMILTLEAVDSKFPQVLPAGVISPKSRFTNDVTAASLGALTGTHPVADRRRATVDHFVPKDH
jgi:hypothetical protein